MATLRVILINLLLLMSTLAVYEIARVAEHSADAADRASAAIVSVQNMAIATTTNVDLIRQKLDSTVYVIGRMAGNIEKATRGLNVVMDAEATALKATSDQLNQLVSNTDKSLNGPNGMLPELSNIAIDVDGSVIASKSLLINANATVTNFNTLISDPAWVKTAHDLQTMADHGNAIATNVEYMSNDLRD